MIPVSNYTYYNISLGEVSLASVIATIEEFIKKDPEKDYTLVIGTDSHEKLEADTGEKTLHIVTAIVIYRRGFGGRYFWKRKKLRHIHTLREKIYAETIESLDFAKKFIPIIQDVLQKENLSYNVEIHVDVGQIGATRDMIKEVVGMVTGMGFVARTKPQSFAASYVADKHV